MSEVKDAVRKVPHSMLLGKKPSITIFSFQSFGDRYLLPICIVAISEANRNLAEGHLLDGLSRMFPSISIHMRMTHFFNMQYLENLKDSKKAYPITATGLVSSSSDNLSSYYEHLEDVVKNKKPDPFIVMFGDHIKEITQITKTHKYINTGTINEYDGELYFEYVHAHLKYELFTLDEFFTKQVPLLEVF